MRSGYCLSLVGLLVSRVLVGQTGTQPSAAAAEPQSVQPAQAIETSNFTSAKGFVLEDSTPVKLRINRTISSGDSKVGDTVDFEVLQDISINGTLVIPKGGLAYATVTEAQAKRRMGRAGELDINIEYVKLVNGDKAALRAIKEVQGGSHVVGMTAGIVATSLVFFPAAPFFLFMHGKDIAIPKGTEITAYVNGDMKLDLAKFQPAQLAPATPAVAPNPVPATPAQVQLQVTSAPDGADIEVDGSFVGSTPSTVGIAPGQHQLSVKKTGFKAWERKITVSSGQVKVNAVLEPEAK